MNNTKKYITKQFMKLFCIALLPITYSCNDDLVDEITSINYKRSFSVTDVEIEQRQTEVFLKWKAALNTATKPVYVIEVSQDENFTGGAEESFESNTNSIIITELQIPVRKDYYARIKTTEEGREDSKWIYSDKFRIIGDQYLNEIKYDDTYSDKVIVRWDVTKNVTHLVLNGGGKVDEQISLDPADLAAGFKEISNLTPATSYTVAIFDGAADKGERTFSTRLGVPAGNTINLVSGDDIRAKIMAATNGDVFILPQGVTFSATQAIPIPEGVSITIFGEEGPNKPTISLGNNFQFPAVGGDIKFQNVKLTANNAAYVFNTASGSPNTVESLIFENCEISGFTTSVMRLQGTTAKKYIKNIVFDRCIVSNINLTQNNYAVIDANSGTADALVIDNIQMTNSTFNNIGRGLIRSNSANSNSLIIKDCTIYDISQGGDTAPGYAERHLIDFNTKSVASVTIENVIVAKSKTVTARGIRMDNVYSATNSYKTSDYIVVLDPLSGFTNYSGSSADLFQDPDNGDFRIKDNGFSGRLTAGDPRWR